MRTALLSLTFSLSLIVTQAEAQWPGYYQPYFYGPQYYQPYYSYQYQYNYGAFGPPPVGVWAPNRYGGFSFNERLYQPYGGYSRTVITPRFGGGSVIQTWRRP